MTAYFRHIAKVHYAAYTRRLCWDWFISAFCFIPYRSS